MTEAEREKIKLRASYLNGLALIFFGIGGFGPVMAALNTFELWRVGISIAWFWAGAMASWELHGMAARYLVRAEQLSSY